MGNIVQKKDKKITIVVIMLVIVVILGIVSFVCYNKEIFKNEKNVEEKNKITREKLALDDERFIGIYEKLKSYTYSTVRANGYTSFMDDDLNTICAGELVNTDFTDTGELTQFGTKYYSFSGSKCDDVLVKYFGNATSFNKDYLVGNTLKAGVNFPEGDGMTVESYDANTDTYKVYFSAVGGVESTLAKIESRKLVSAELVGDEIIVEEKAIYVMDNYTGVEDKITYTVYSDPDLTDIIGTNSYTIAEVANQTISVDDYLDKSSIITYKFKLNPKTNEYYFVSSIIE